MADTKISALPASTTPLAGTEVLPIVQSSATKQVSVANLTAGRAISATQITLTTGNVIVASGQGVDFSATAGTGTSELLADYEEGTWTPTVASTVGTITTYTSSGIYTKVGRQVTLTVKVTIVAAGTGSGNLSITNVPFNFSATDTYAGCGREINTTGNALQLANYTTSALYMQKYDNTYQGATGDVLIGTITYFV
jgi:hypothetical protein